MIISCLSITTRKKPATACSEEELIKWSGPAGKYLLGKRKYCTAQLVGRLLLIQAPLEVLKRNVSFILMVTEVP